MHILKRAFRRAALITTAALFIAPAAAPAAAPVFGYGDNGTAMFADARWQALPLKDVRRTVDWDTPGDPVKVAALDEWMAAAQAAGARPLLAIDRTWTAGREKTKPKLAEYRALIAWLRERYPWWNTLTPWNEANFRLQPTYKNPRLAYDYWRAARKTCVGCTVTSPVILAGKGINTKWLKSFLKITRGKARPKLWAVHVYADHNRGTDRSLRAFERQLRGEIWVTEAAGWVKFVGKRWPYNEKRAAKAVRTIFKTAKKHKRVKRWYFYQWRGPVNPADRWDSGVLNADGTERVGYRELVAGLSAQGGTR